MIASFPAYLFDIDGTLLESAPDICAAVRAVLARTPCKDVPDSYLQTFIGRHLFDLFEELLPEYNPRQNERLLAEYRAVYLERGHKLTKPYPGVPEALAKLGGRKSTATTKGTPTARSVLDQFGLLPHFDHVQGTDGFPSKPKPDVVFKAIGALGVTPEQCLLVGDSGPDMEAGRRAGVKICAVRYGYGNLDEMARWQPDFWIDHPMQLVS